MPPRRVQRMDEVYGREDLQRLEQRFEQRIEQLMEQGMNTMMDRLTLRMGELLANRNRAIPNQERNPTYDDRRNPFAAENDDGDDFDVDYEEAARGRRGPYAVEDDRRRWETGMRTEIPEFCGTLQPEEFIDWLATVEEILEFKGVPDDKRVPLVATRLRDRAMAWWQQLKQTRVRLGKSKITNWEKMKKQLRAAFLPYNYQRLMYQWLQNLKQGGRTVDEYTTEFYQLIA